jgi:hypothetical protein
MHFHVTMISKVSDYDVELRNIFWESLQEAKQRAPMMMATPDMWLVTSIFDAATDEQLF